MSLFQVPSQTRYDLNFSVAGIRVRVHPLFWLIAILFAGSSSSPTQVLIWIGVVFISILLHELGHSFAMRMYGVDSYIVLHGFGGLAVPLSSYGGVERGSLRPQQNIVISLAGPFAGFALAVTLVLLTVVLGGAVIPNFVFGFIPIPALLLPFGGGLLTSIVMTFMWVNIFWGVINLLPVFPLDGGRVSQNVFILADPYDGLKRSLWLSVYVGGAIALWGLMSGSLYMAILFGMLAGQSYQMVSGSRLRY